MNAALPDSQRTQSHSLQGRSAARSRAARRRRFRLPRVGKFAGPHLDVHESSALTYETDALKVRDA